MSNSGFNCTNLSRSLLTENLITLQAFKWKRINLNEKHWENRKKYAKMISELYWKRANIKPQKIESLFFPSTFYFPVFFLFSSNPICDWIYIHVMYASCNAFQSPIEFMNVACERSVFQSSWAHGNWKERVSHQWTQWSVPFADFQHHGAYPNFPFYFSNLPPFSKHLCSSLHFFQIWISRLLQFIFCRPVFLI